MKFKKAAAVLLGLVVLATSFASCSINSGKKKFDYSAGLTDDGFFKNIKATDYVTLPEYKGVPISPEVLVASEEDLNQQIANLLARYTTYEQITDRAVADGDTINIEYVGKIDGKEFDGGSTNGAGTDVTIGVTQYIDDFLEQLIGHKPGETFDIEVTFPDPYTNNPELSGKDAVFTVTINYIRGKAIEAELSDEIAAEYGFNTKEELIADIERWIINEQKLHFFEELIAGIECEEVPAAIIDYVKKLDVAYYEDYATLYNMDLDAFMATFMGYQSLDAYLEAQADAFKETATRYLIVQAIAETEGLKATDEDITEAGYTDYIKSHGRPYLKLILLHSKIVPNFVVDNAKVDN